MIPALAEAVIDARARNLAWVFVDEEMSDWCAFYLDGHKIYEGPTPRTAEAMRFLLNADPTIHIFPSCDLAHISQMRGMPRVLSRIGNTLVPA